MPRIQLDAFILALLLSGCAQTPASRGESVPGEPAHPAPVEDLPVVLGPVVFTPAEPDFDSDRWVVQALSADPEQQFEAVRRLAVADYSADGVAVLQSVVANPRVGETTRDYAAMGLGNYVAAMSDESRRSVRDGLRGVLEREVLETPDRVGRALIHRFDDARFVQEVLGEHLAGHELEIETLARIRTPASIDRLWVIHETTPKRRKSEVYVRRAAVGRALIDLGDPRGVDVLLDLLPAKNAPGSQYRVNVYGFLAKALDRDFGFIAATYDPDLEGAISRMRAWWSENRASFDGFVEH